MPNDEAPLRKLSSGLPSTAGGAPFGGLQLSVPRLPVFSRLSDVLLGNSAQSNTGTQQSAASSSTQAPSQVGVLPTSSPTHAQQQQEDAIAHGRALGSTSRNSAVEAAEDSEARATNERANSVASSSLPLPSLWRAGPAARSAELSKYFGLPPKEMFLDDYNCALRKKVVLQGRMYIFDHYVCFSSFLFAVTKKVVIPLEHVTSVRKKTNLRIPNSIKIEVAGPHGCSSYFFTSFLSREDAFQLINNCWMQSRARRQELEGGEGTFAFAAGASAAALNSALVPEGGVLPCADVRAVVGAADSSVPGCGAADDDDDDDEGDAVNDSVWSTLTQGAVPPPHSDSQVVVQAVLDGTPKDFFDMLLADNSHMLEDFLDTQGNRRMVLSRWSCEALLGHVRDFQFVSPIKGAFSNWGVPHTECLQSHRFRRFAGDHLVFESSQTMTNIPYGDCFTVDMRWDVTPLQPYPLAAAAGGPEVAAGAAAQGSVVVAGVQGSPFVDLGATAQGDGDLVGPDLAPQMQLTIRVRVPFSRKCLFKKVIESGVIKQVKDTYSLLVEQQLQPQLAQLVADRQPVQLGPAPTSTSRLTPHGTGSHRLFPSQAQHLDAADANGNGVVVGMSRTNSGVAMAAAAARAGGARHVPSSLSGRFAAPSTGGAATGDEGSYHPGGRRGVAHHGAVSWHVRLRRSSVANLRYLTRSLLTPVADMGSLVTDRLGMLVLGGTGTNDALTMSSTTGVTATASGGAGASVAVAAAGLSPSKAMLSQRGGFAVAAHQQQQQQRAAQDSARARWQAGLALLLLVLLVLGVQLLVLSATLRHQRQHFASPHHQHQQQEGPSLASSLLQQVQGLVGGSSAATAAGASDGASSTPSSSAAYQQAQAESGLDAFVAVTRDMWSRRVALLEAELRLVEQHRQTVQEQLQLAHMYAGGAVNGAGAAAAAAAAG